MIFRKIFAVLAILIFSATILTGCGEEKKVEAPATSEFKIGMLRHMNADEGNFNDLLKEISKTFDFKMSAYDPIFFNSLKEMQSGLDSGMINSFITYKNVANYIVAQNPSFEIVDSENFDFTEIFCFALRESDKDLFRMVDKAVVEMDDDGTLKELVKNYITDVKDEKNVSAVEIQNIAGASTIKVAVTGDLPPIDLIDEEGKATGFNTAILAEISKRIGRNIELVHINSGERAAALTSGRVDIVFWAILPVVEIISPDSDKPENVEVTTPYYRNKVVQVRMKK